MTNSMELMELTPFGEMTRIPIQPRRLHPILKAAMIGSLAMAEMISFMVDTATIRSMEVTETIPSTVASETIRFSVAMVTT